MKMKYRLVKTATNTFYVEEKTSIFSKWKRRRSLPLGTRVETAAIKEFNDYVNERRQMKRIQIIAKS